MPAGWKLAPSLCLFTALVLARSPLAQGDPLIERGTPVEVSTGSKLVVFEGVVLGPDGAPAPGAVVVSSAGGRAVTGLDGGYRLELQVPVESESVQITAIGSGNRRLLASASVELSATPASAHVGPLELAQSGACEPGWLPTFGPLPGTDPSVQAMAVFDDGSGPALYVGGYFTFASGVTVNGIARWDGSGWMPLGSGMDGGVLALAVFDDGSGPALYAGGRFFTAGGAAASRIARWNGSSWAPLGSGVSGGAGGVGVNALTVFDAGGGPRLYAGGEFTTAGGNVVNNIASWDGSSWAPLGSGVSSNGDVNALQVFDAGSGPALYVGGSFSHSP